MAGEKEEKEGRCKISRGRGCSYNETLLGGEGKI